MEPAAGRREHYRDDLPVHLPTVAAMKPPWNGGSTIYTNYAAAAASLPQWSPPPSGGITPALASGVTVEGWLPQWGPPLNGGSTGPEWRG